MKNITRLIIILFLIGPAVGHAQDESRQSGGSFKKASSKLQQKLEESLDQLSDVRRQIADEKLPLSRKLSDLESELAQTRNDYQQKSRLLDSRTLNLSNLRSELKTREEEATYLSNLLSEYIRNFESRLHISEIQQYENILEEASLAPKNNNLTKQEVYETQAVLVDASLQRLHDIVGGRRFEGVAVDEDGMVTPGTFLLVGPAALFRSADGEHVGTAEQRLGSLEPAILEFTKPENTNAAEQIITSSQGYFPFDPTLGNAHVIASTQDTIWEHIQKGGPVMIPIFILAGAALLVAVYKWIGLLFVRKPSRKRLAALLDAVGRNDTANAQQTAKQIRGPAGNMLTAGANHLDEPRDLIEEIMYETVLTTRLRLQRWLPFIAICAAAAPLLGLLGTVTGIINTFKLITVFGTGDVKTLSGGISEALITTEFGLIVAIPSLLLHAFLSRKARSVIDQMEKSAVAFANQVGKAQRQRERERVAHAEAEVDEHDPEVVVQPTNQQEAESGSEHESDEPSTARETNNHTRSSRREVVARS